MKNTREMKRVLVTGSTGFLGKAVLEILNCGNYELITTNSSLHDLTNLDECKILTKNIDVIINLAGLVLSRNEQKARPAEVFFTNTIISLNIAEAARQNNVRRIIFISSVTAYPENIPSPFSETDLWKGPVTDANYAYGTAKRITETIARAYNDQYDIETCTLFLPNLYGPNDKFDYTPPPLIPNIINQIQQSVKEDAAVLKGGNNGDSTLDLLYVTDAANAIKCALETNNLPPLLNISTGTTISIKEVYSNIAKILSYKGTIEWEPGNPPTPRIMDTSKAQEHIGWKNITSFETGITNTINSFLQK